jgi:hypothetical protein
MFQVDPACWRVSRFRRSRWPGKDGDWRESYAASFERNNGGPSQTDVSELLDVVKRWKPPPVGTDDGDLALVVNLSDWQIGKGEEGGTRATVERVLALGPAVERRIAELRDTGRGIGQLVVHGLGDMVESCDGFYAMQSYGVDLDRRQQLRVTWRLLAELLRRWVPLAPELTVGAVAGNHGENRKDGKAFTTFGDNDDLTVFEVVADVLGGAPGFEHVKWLIPDNRLTFAHDIRGISHGVAHGHQARGAAGAAAIKKWWEGQAFGVREMMHAQILATGHFHHLSVVEYAESGRTHMQAPAMDGGSQWYAESSGLSAPPGTLTYVVGAACGVRGWQDLAVL